METRQLAWAMGEAGPEPISTALVCPHRVEPRGRPRICGFGAKCFGIEGAGMALDPGLASNSHGRL